jgi:RNA polymerase sigma-70 factor (ECF subfamily)
MQRVNLDIRRRANPVRRADSLQALAQGLDGEPQELAVKDLSPLPDEAVMRDALRADLLDAIYELPDVYRKAILLCDLEGHTYSEIAELEATTIGTIRSRIHRGRRLLRESILRRQSLAGEEVESLCLN